MTFQVPETQDFWFRDNHQQNKDMDFFELWNSINTNSDQSCSNDNEQSSLSNLIGDITPAAAAVCGIVEESPVMNTPLLDMNTPLVSSCMSTPFTPNNVLFTPHQNQYTTHYYSPFIEQSMPHDMPYIDPSPNDVTLTAYLKTNSSWQNELNQNTLTSAITAPMLNQTTSDITTNELFGSLSDISININPNQLSLNNINDNTNDLISDLFNNIENEEGFDDTMFDFNEDAINMPSFDHESSFIIPKAPETELVKVKDIKKVKKREKTSIRITKLKSQPEDEKRFQCNLCDLKFSRRYNLGTHIKTHDKSRNKEFGCEACGKLFDRKHDLSRHVSTVHKGERAFGCTVCESVFSRKDALVRHRIQKHNLSS